MAEELQDGFTCECGEYEKYPAYVYAHWCTPLTYTCEKCGVTYVIFRGNAHREEKK